MENRKELVFKEIELQEINPIYKVLDDWNNYYDWRVYKGDFMYILEDTQTGELEHFTYLFELLRRLSSRALDYETDEREYDDEKISIETFNYLNTLLFIFTSETHNLSDYDKKWVDSKIDFIRDLLKKEMK